MSRESITWLNTNTLIGFTSRRGTAGTGAPKNTATPVTTTWTLSRSRTSRTGCSRGPPTAAGWPSRPPAAARS